MEFDMRTARSVLAAATLLLGTGFLTSVSHAAPARTGTNVTVSAVFNSTTGSFAFKPGTVTVTRGFKVIWKNTTTVTHTVTRNTPGFNKTLAPGATVSVQFNTVGTYHYHCNIHPNMVGTINVVA
jgi:plastocyanin